MAHLCRLLSLNRESFATFLATELGYPDTGSGPDDTTVTNSGFTKRKSLFFKDGTAAPKVPLLGVLTHDLSNVKNLILPNVDLKIKMYKNDPKVSK